MEDKTYTSTSLLVAQKDKDISSITNKLSELVDNETLTLADYYFKQIIGKEIIRDNNRKALVVGCVILSNPDRYVKETLLRFLGAKRSVTVERKIALWVTENQRNSHHEYILAELYNLFQQNNITRPHIKLEIIDFYNSLKPTIKSSKLLSSASYKTIAICIILRYLRNNDFDDSDFLSSVKPSKTTISKYINLLEP